jgi:glycosyltransferase involved in cell wall biosynthesis
MNVGGPARHVGLLQRHLPTRGYQSTLVTGVVGDGEVEMSPVEAAGAPIERTVIAELGRTVRAGDDVRALRHIVRLLRDLEPDIVHTHTAKAGAIGRVAAAAFNATRGRARRAAVIHTFHGHVLRGYFSPAVDRAVRITERGLATLTDRIIAISPAQRHDLVNVFRVAPDRKVSVVSLGLDLDALAAAPARSDALRNEAGFPDASVVCGYVGRFAPIKHLDLLVRAFAQVAAADPRARLMLVGDGEARDELQRLTAALGVADRTFFAGWRANLADVYGAIDIVALTSRNEGTPVALIEAGAAGKAIVATKVGGVGDVVHLDRTGVLVADDDLNGMAAALLALVRDEGRRRTLGAAARADMTSRFGLARLVDDLDGLYRDVLRRSRGTAS